jgi:hypothetical protein
MERSQPLAGLVTVTVKSWQSRQQTTVIETASNNAASSGSPQAYVFLVPNLMPATALQLANTKLAELTSHERAVVADMPGELALTPRMPVSVAGTGTAFDQIYWIEEMTRSLHWRRGFVQSLRARASSPSATTGTTGS